MSQHDAATLIIATAIGLRDESSLDVQLRNLPGRGFAIVLVGWSYDGENVARIQATEPAGEVVANSGKTPVATSGKVVANPEVEQ